MKYRNYLTAILLFVFGTSVLAQAPDMYPPTVPEPVENPVLYIVVTLAVIAIYLIYRYTQNKKRNKKQENN